MRIGVLNNLRAGRSRSRVHHVLQVLSKHREVVHLETRSGAAVPGALELLAKERVEILVVNGGDGTLQRVLTEILGHPERKWMPLLAPVRGGRTNQSALDIGSHRRPDRGIADLIEAVRQDRIEQRIVVRPVLRVSIDPSEGAQYGMFFGVGVLHRAIQLVHAAFPHDARGVLGAGLVTGTLIARAAMGDHQGVLDPDRLSIALDDERIDGEYMLAMASTLQRLFLRMRPFWGTEPAPVRFTSVESGAGLLRRAAGGILRGRPGPVVTPENGYLSRNVRSLEITLDAGATIDGELFDPRPGRTIRVDAEEGVRFVRA